MRILFLCKDNGARSQMAEGLARQMFEVASTRSSSAGIEPGRMHPFVLRDHARDQPRHRRPKSRKALAKIASAGIDLIVVVCERDISADTSYPAPSSASIGRSWILLTRRRRKASSASACAMCAWL